MPQPSEDVLKDYRRWLYTVARNWRPNNPDIWDDLVQEGHVAMWHALETFDPERGSLPSWLTAAAKMRMRDVLRRPGGVFLGKPSRRGQYAQDLPTPVSTDWDWVHAAVGTSESCVEDAMMAYHTNEFSEAIGALSSEDREYVYRRFWRGEVSNSKERTAWVRRIRPALREKLAHIVEV